MLHGPFVLALLALVNRIGRSASHRFAGPKIPVLILMAWLIALSGCSGSSTPSTDQTAATPKDPVGANLIEVSSDPYTVAPGQHATEVEPHMVSNGSTLVAAFQTGRISPGGATDIGWATSTDAGTTWTHGFLPGLTTGEGSGPYDAGGWPSFDSS